MKSEEKALLAALTDISGVGDKRAYELYTHFNDPLEIISAPESLMDEYHYVNENTVAELQSLDEIVEVYLDRFEIYESNCISILGIEDDRYPSAVRNDPAPAILYSKGNIELLSKNAVGVSGSRETNEIGQQWIRSVSADLAEKCHNVVSGGARGADTAAHRGALETTNSTIAVLGTGVNVPYPPENQSLFDRIIETDGLLISMRPPDAKPTRHAFLSRNKLIAALSDGMIFVATDGNGGTMAQYEMALERNIPTFVPPPDLAISPSDGLATIHDADTTKIIKNASEFEDMLPTGDPEQTGLDEWN